MNEKDEIFEQKGEIFKRFINVNLKFGLYECGRMSAFYWDTKKNVTMGATCYHAQTLDFEEEIPLKWEGWDTLYINLDKKGYYYNEKQLNTIRENNNIFRKD